MSNLVLTATNFLEELLRKNDWEVRQTPLRFPSSNNKVLEGYETEGIYKPHEVSVYLNLVELYMNKVAVGFFKFEPTNNYRVWIGGHEYYNGDSFLADFGKTIAYQTIPDKCWIIKEPIDILSLIESYDRVARALHYETILKGKDNT